LVSLMHCVLLTFDYLKDIQLHIAYILYINPNNINKVSDEMNNELRLITENRRPININYHDIIWNKLRRS